MTDKTREPNQRILSLEYLRGVAALLVLYAHVIVVGLTDRGTPHRYFPQIPALSFTPNDFFSIWSARPEEWLERVGLNSGHIGVAIFFLISGYLVVGIANQTTPTRFLIGRFFRVVPPFWFASVLSGLLAFYFQLRGQPIAFSLKEAIRSSLFLPTLTPPVPTVWSLICETWFYVVVGTAIACFKSPLTSRRILIIAVACFALIVLIGDFREMFDWLNPWYLSYNSMFIIFIMIGGAIKVSNDRLLPIMIFILFAGAERIHFTTFRIDDDFSLFSSLTAIVVFYTSLKLEKHFRHIRLLRFFADISYPLYLVHIPFAWILLNWMYLHSWPGVIALPATVAICILLAYALHITVELPFHNLGRRLSQTSRVKNIDSSQVSSA